VFCISPASAAISCVLSIGGLDPSGGAGLPADARAIRAFGAHPCAVATAVIAQNTQGVQHVEAVSAQMLSTQLNNLLDDIAPRAVKIGMIANREQVQVLLECWTRWRDVPTVLDPVFAPSAGEDFSDDATVQMIATELFPRCALVTPNSVEAERLCGFAVRDVKSMTAAGRAIQTQYGAHRVLVKGGHLPQTNEVVDVLCDGAHSVVLSAKRIEGAEVRGTGCLLASAIAAQLAQNVEIKSAVERAKSWLAIQIRDAQQLGKGRRIAV